MSLYVQLSRAESWEGLHPFRKPARGDFERLGDETRRRFEQGYRNEAWF
jgi:hypothetical protein